MIKLTTTQTHISKLMSGSVTYTNFELGTGAVKSVNDTSVTEPLQSFPIIQSVFKRTANGDTENSDSLQYEINYGDIGNQPVTIHEFALMAKDSSDVAYMAMYGFSESGIVVDSSMTGFVSGAGKMLVNNAQNFAYTSESIPSSFLTNHIGMDVASENGVHNFRYFGGSLAYYDEAENPSTGQPIGWVNVSYGGSGSGDVTWAKDSEGNVIVAGDGKITVTDGESLFPTNVMLSSLTSSASGPIVWQVDADPSVISLSRNIATGEVFNFFAKVSNSANATMNDGTGALPVVFLTGLGANNDTISISENMFVPGQIYEITKTATEYVAAIVLEWFFDTPTTQTWQCPKTGYYAISAVGGGGSAGNIPAGTQYSGASGGGGAGGCAFLHNYFIQKGTTYSYTVGKGGKKDDIEARNGTASMFNNTLIASNGGQGRDCDSNNRTTFGGNGGSAMGGDENIGGQGGFGSHVSLQAVIGGAGGSSFWGPGGKETGVRIEGTLFAGEDAYAPGAGGGGAARSLGTGRNGVLGGNGGDGRIHIKYQSHYFKH